MDGGYNSIRYDALDDVLTVLLGDWRCGLQAISVYVDASKGFTIATFVSIQGVYLAKKLLESVVLHGQKVVVHCNRATTARLRMEKFKYGEEEREAETKVKGKIEELVEACNQEEEARGDRGERGLVDGEDQGRGAATAANEFLASLAGGGDGSADGGAEGGVEAQRRSELSRDSHREYQLRYDLMKRNEKSRLARLEKEADKRRDMAQERQRQVLADNEGVGDPRATWPLHERKAYRGSREHLERKKRNIKELEEDEKEAARIASEKTHVSGVGVAGGGGSLGGKDAVGSKENDDGGARAANAGDAVHAGIKRKKPAINFDDEKEDVMDTVKVNIQKEATLAGSIMQRLPKTMDQLNAYPIKWDVFDAASKAVHSKISEWIGNKIAELLGEEEEFVEYIFEGIQKHKHPRDLVADVQDVLDDDTDPFVIELYGKVIFEIEKLATV